MIDQYFTPGPVQMASLTETVGVGQLPYFRTSLFSKITKECESMLLELSSASEGSHVVFLTASGTGAMDAAIANLIDKNESSLVLNAGAFGQRFVDLLAFYDFSYNSIDLEDGRSFDSPTLLNVASITDSQNLIYNLHETTTGALHDIDILSETAKKQEGVHIVDAISSFLCDDVNMEKFGIDALILSSQKAFALAPGLSMMVLSPKAIERIQRIPSKSYYFNLKDYLINGERGQSPYTPAVGVMLQLHERLKKLIQKPYTKWVEDCRTLSTYFRQEISRSCFDIFPKKSSNAITALSCNNCILTAIDVVQLLEKEGIWVSPNGGELAETIFRVGHMGNLKKNDYNNMISLLNNIEGKA